MKSSGYVFRLSVLAILLSFGLVVMAQSEPAEPQERHSGRMMMQTPEQRLDRLSQQLNLSAEQKEKIKPILENQANQMKSLREDTSTSREDRRAKFMELQQKTHDDINAVLNKDQQKKFEEMRSRMMQRRGGRGGPGGERPQGPPPSY